MQLIQVENINLVQVDIDATAKKDDGVLIDSRVYCRDVIKVNHSDWLQNVLYKHQTQIEQRFGILRFENGKIYNDVKRGRPSKYVMMTRAQTNYALLLSNNDPDALEAKAQLIEDFENALNWRAEYLERQLIAQPQDTTQLDALKAEHKKAVNGLVEQIKQLIEENHALKKDSDEGWIFGAYYQKQSKEFEELLNIAIKQGKRLKEELAKEKAGKDWTHISPDIKVSRAFWAEIMSLRLENQELKKQLGLPPK